MPNYWPQSFYPFSRGLLAKCDSGATLATTENGHLTSTSFKHLIIKYPKYHLENSIRPFISCRNKNFEKKPCLKVILRPPCHLEDNHPYIPYKIRFSQSLGSKPPGLAVGPDRVRLVDLPVESSTPEYGKPFSHLGPTILFHHQILAFLGKRETVHPTLEIGNRFFGMMDGLFAVRKRWMTKGSGQHSFTFWN